MSMFEFCFCRTIIIALQPGLCDDMALEGTEVRIRIAKSPTIIITMSPVQRVNRDTKTATFAPPK